MINSKQKGKRGELEIVNYLKDKGYDVRRSVQFNGISGLADVLCEELPFHIEVKRDEKLNVEKALQQAERDTKGQTPVVFHRKNKEEWKITMRLDEFLKLIESKL